MCVCVPVGPTAVDRLLRAPTLYSIHVTAAAAVHPYASSDSRAEWHSFTCMVLLDTCSDEARRPEGGGAALGSDSSHN